MSAASSEDDECICRVCRFSWGIDLPVPATDVDDLPSLHRQAKQLSIAIFRSWVLLNKTLKRYEDIICKRWTKKNNVQRTKVLLSAWPAMAATHRPDFAQLRDIGQKGCRRRVNRAKEREANIWPYINLEDLVQPANLLSFLNARGRCLPHKFAFQDHICAHVARPSSKSEDVNQCRMVLHGKTTPMSYAAISIFEPGDNADIMGLHPTTGLLILEIQDRILDFLVSCCRLILHDVNLDTTDLYPTKRSTPPTSTSSLSWRTVTALANEAPYRIPQRLDLHRLCMLVEAKRSEAEEHIWSLREDPGYFSLHLQEWSEHSTEMVLDKYKMRHKSVGTPSFWNRQCKNIIGHAYRCLIFLDELYEELKLVILLTKRHKKSIQPSKRLPRELEKVYQKLDKLVEEMRHGPLNDLVIGVPASPPLRKGFERDARDVIPRIHDLTIKPASSGPTWYVNVLFRTLLSEEQHQKHGLTNIVGEIQRTLDEHSAESDSITPWVTSRFADLALVVEIGHQLDLFQPWSTMWRHYSDKKLLDADYDEIAAINDMVDQAVVCTTIDIDPANFAYPSDKRKNKDTVARMRASEKSLDHLWKKFDEHCIQHTGYNLHHFLYDFFKERQRRLQRTPPWVEPKSKGPSCTEQKVEPKLSTTTAPRSLPLQQLDPNARCSHPGKAELLENSTPGKVKIKSRPAAARFEREELADTKASVSEDISSNRIMVTKRAYKVFSTIFHMVSDQEHHNRGEVAWNEFLYAMSSIGFSPEKLYGYVLMWTRFFFSFCFLLRILTYAKGQAGSLHPRRSMSREVSSSMSRIRRQRCIFGWRRGLVAD